MAAPRPELCIARTAYLALSHAHTQFGAARMAWLAREDGDALHDVRVALRRLRAGVTLYDELIRLPRVVTVRRLRRLGRRLAPLRDLDVALGCLSPTAGGNPGVDAGGGGPGELRTRLQRARVAARREAIAALRGRRTRRWYRALRRWLRAPTVAEVALREGPEMLRPRLDERRLALAALPGWTVEAPTLATATATADALEHLHRLRRRAKQTRYLLELGDVAGISGGDAAIARLERVQDGLGALQDQHLLRDVLARELGAGWPALLPDLSTRLEAEWDEAWRAWDGVRRADDYPRA